MSIIAGCSLFSGVILLADCRITIKRYGKSDILCDNVQKMFPLTNTTALGFVGDLRTAATMIRELLRQQSLFNNRSKTNRSHPLNILKWLPRYFRSSYRQLARRQNVDRIDFMVASVILDRQNVIERAKVVEIMERFRLGKLSAHRNWMPNILVDILKAETPYVILSDIPANLLYYMRSPDFVPQHLAPLEFAAIGSGEDTIIEIDKNADWIFAGEVGNSFMEASALRQTVSSFIYNNDILSVGGMYPVLKIHHKGIELLGHSAQIPVGGPTFELKIDSNRRWLQRNSATGKEIQLLLPWEIDLQKHQKDERFDDFKDALYKFRKYGNSDH